MSTLRGITPRRESRRRREALGGVVHIEKGYGQFMKSGWGTSCRSSGGTTRAEMVTEESEGTTVSRHLSLAAVDHLCDHPESLSPLVTRLGLMATLDPLTYLTRSPWTLKLSPPVCRPAGLQGCDECLRQARAFCRCGRSWRTDPRGPGGSTGCALALEV